MGVYRRALHRMDCIETPPERGTCSHIGRCGRGILNLSIWFALHVLFADVQRQSWGPVAVWWPDTGTINPLALTLAGAAAVLLLWGERGVLLTLAICSVLGLASGFVFAPFG